MSQTSRRVLIVLALVGTGHDAAAIELARRLTGAGQPPTADIK